jgi:hypothetical protein
MESCWLDEKPVESNQILYLNQSGYFNSRNLTNHLAELSCRIQNQPNRWINFNFDNTNDSVLFSKLAKRQILTAFVNAKKFLYEVERVFIYKINLVESNNNYLFAYEIDPENEPEFVNNLFDLDRFTGVLTTNPSGIFDFRTILAQVNQLSLKFSLLVFDSQSLSLKKQFNYDLNVIFEQANSHTLTIEDVFSDLNGQLFSKNVSLTHESENSQVREIQNGDNLSFTIRQIFQAYISNATMTTVQEANLFYLSTSLKTNITHLFITTSMLADFMPKIYLIEMNICQFDFECKLARFNVKLNFYSAYSLTFTSKRFTFLYFNFNQSQHSLISSNFELIDFTKSLLNLRKMIHSPDLMGRGFAFAPRKSSSLISSSNEASTFYLDRTSGRVFAREAIQVNKAFSFDIDLLNDENIILSTTSISIEINQIPHRIVRTIQVNLNQLYDNSDLAELVIVKNLFKLGSVNTNFNFNLTCVNIDQFECQAMFGYTSNSSNLILRVNKISVRNLLKLSEFQINLSFFNANSKLISTHLTLRIELVDTNSSHISPIASRIVFINSTFDLNEFGSCALRTVNLLNDKQMTYTNPSSEAILRNLEQNELYEFNLYPNNVTIYSLDSIYQIVFAAKYNKDIVTLKHFLNFYDDELLRENKFYINLTRFDQNVKNTFNRDIYLISRISSTEYTIREEFNFNYLSKFFKINANALYFDTDYLSMFLSNDEVLKFEDLFDSAVVDFIVNRFTIDSRLNKIIEVVEHQVKINCQKSLTKLIN